MLFLNRSWDHLCRPVRLSRTHLVALYLRDEWAASDLDAQNGVLGLTIVVATDEESQVVVVDTRPFSVNRS